jgi:Carboxypeptidase regulatory-like domain
MARFLGLFLATFAFVPAAFPQAEAVNARLSGTVLDPNNAVVPGAKVTLSNPETGFSRQFTSEENGRYVFTVIPPGTYQLRVEKEGFNAYSQSGITLAVGQSAALDPRWAPSHKLSKSRPPRRC